MRTGSALAQCIARALLSQDIASVSKYICLATDGSKSRLWTDTPDLSVKSLDKEQLQIQRSLEDGAMTPICLCPCAFDLAHLN